MKIYCVWEHNQNDSLLYSSNVIGAFTRGTSKEEALEKMPGEISSYFAWLEEPAPSSMDIEINQEKASDLDIHDADSDVLFNTERLDLSVEQYTRLKGLVLKSAEDFLRLYNTFPDKHKTVLLPRKTFYGTIPCTASEMYLHTKNVNAYYWGEIGLEVSNEGTIVESRMRGFEALELNRNFLSGSVYSGSYGEELSIPKVLRRFLWHDRIHAKAMYKMGIRTFGVNVIPNVFSFKL